MYEASTGTVKNKQVSNHMGMYLVASYLSNPEVLPSQRVDNNWRGSSQEPGLYTPKKKKKK